MAALSMMQFSMNSLASVHPVPLVWDCEGHCWRNKRINHQRSKTSTVRAYRESDDSHAKQNSVEHGVAKILADSGIFLHGILLGCHCCDANRQAAFVNFFPFIVVNIVIDQFENGFFVHSIILDEIQLFENFFGYSLDGQVIKQNLIDSIVENVSQSLHIFSAI